MSKQIQDLQTGELITLVPVSEWYKGNAMSDDYVDNILYFKGGSNESPYYKRYIEDHINVKWFGAKGDGIHDDTASIQSAFDYLIDIREYKDVLPRSYDLCCLIPDGKYLIKSTLLFPAFCTLKGESRDGSILYTDRNDISLLFISEDGTPVNQRKRSTADHLEEYTIIRDLTVAGNNYLLNPTAAKPTPNSFGVGIMMDKVLQVNIQNCSVQGFEMAGIFSHFSAYISITDSLLFNNRIGLLADSLSTCIFASHSVFRVNSQGISLYDSFSCSFVNCLIEANVANYLTQINGYPELSKCVGVHIKNCKNINFTNSYFEAHLENVILDSSNSNIFSNTYFAPFENADFGNSTAVVKFNGSSSYNKFIDNYYDAFNAQVYSPYTFSVENKSLSKGNVFEFTLKDHLDSFISQNAAEFTEFRTLGLAQNAPKFICTGANEQFTDAERRFITDKTFGSTTERPTVNLYKGQHYFDSTLGKPIFWQGVKWVKADGTDA
ncbi:right-handed parallel beta-helix repeat-containing protein [Chryseobacterium sp.]|uniref:right-handed parallel beta-helix repeat-containing protein n=1 Tax=Chryseobacterium sp. TaxID=1871047 RepID=UPI0028A08A87|nr:glycosyl hydrolase family 28-related protein [Chryseobacterium sp.]